MPENISTKLSQEIELLNSLISRILQINPSSDILKLKYNFLIKLKQELESLQTKNIKNVKNLKKIIEFLDYLAQNIISNKENIDINYLKQM
ncbi:hypothetical protein EOM09_05880, partial [bacterium]|nr:hypothetical protein [bacterium]